MENDLNIEKNLNINDVITYVPLEIIKGLIGMIVEEIIKHVVKSTRKRIKKIKTRKEIKRKPAHAYGLQPGKQCVSRTYDLLVYRKLAPGQYGLEARGMPQELAPGESLSIPLDFTEAGAVWLVIKSDVSSNVPVIFKAQGQRIWATQPSTRIVGNRSLNLWAPDFYELRIENPSSATASLTGRLDVTMCGRPAVESWPRQHIKSAIMDVALDGAETPIAPMGIAVYSVKKDEGRYSTYILTTDAVKGVVHISHDVSASGYRRDGSYYGQAFSVQLNAFVVVQLKDGTKQYYWIRNIVGFKENKIPGIWNKILRIIQRLFKHKRLKVRNYIEDVTTAISTLESRVRGRGKIYNKPAGPGNYYEYVMRGSIPFDRVELETWVRADDGKIIVEFYANGQKYDEVTITPDPPADSAYIEIAPATTPTGYPLDLELVFGGYDSDIPFTVLKRGWIGLKLYVRMNGEWTPPPSAWSVGSATRERSYAYVEPQGVGSALVVSGVPIPRQLW